MLIDRVSMMVINGGGRKSSVKFNWQSKLKLHDDIGLKGLCRYFKRTLWFNYEGVVKQKMDFEIITRNLKSALNRYAGGIKLSSTVDYGVSDCLPWMYWPAKKITYNYL